jgi:pyruvate ferredoxin oxidoreductase delta subunit
VRKPCIEQFVKPEHISDYPLGPCFRAGHLVSDNSSWRTKRPVIDQSSCRKCGRCYFVCPEGTVEQSDSNYDIDYAFCKGCGICAKECPHEAIKMIEEERV